MATVILSILSGIGGFFAHWIIARRTKVSQAYEEGLASLFKFLEEYNQIYTYLLVIKTQGSDPNSPLWQELRNTILDYKQNPFEKAI